MHVHLNGGLGLELQSVLGHKAAYTHGKISRQEAAIRLIDAVRMSAPAVWASSMHAKRRPALQLRPELNAALAPSMALQVEKHPEAEEGLFLVREPSKGTGFVLNVLDDDCDEHIRNYLFTPAEGGGFMLISAKFEMQTMDELIQYFKAEHREGMCAKLGGFVSVNGDIRYELSAPSSIDGERGSVRC